MEIQIESCPLLGASEGLKVETTQPIKYTFCVRVLHCGMIGLQCLIHLVIIAFWVYASSVHSEDEDICMNMRVMTTYCMMVSAVCIWADLTFSDSPSTATCIMDVLSCLVLLGCGLRFQIQHEMASHCFFWQYFQFCFWGFFIKLILASMWYVRITEPGLRKK